jgi:hypothetical protein
MLKNLFDISGYHIIPIMNKEKAINSSWIKFSKRIKELTADYLKLVKKFNEQKSAKNMEEIRNQIKDF